MVRHLSYLIIICFTFLTAQDRVLLRIGKNGEQEAIPLKKGEQAKEVIQRLEQRRSEIIYRPGASAGLYDTLRYYGSDADLTTNFGWTHQDVALQWYDPQAYGTIKEFWWYNNQQQGVTKKATIRAWHIDPRVKNFPVLPNTKFLGAYKDAMDGDGGVQPFKPASGDQWFYSNGAADSVNYSFDPILAEAQWLPGGLQVTLDSNVWQGITVDDGQNSFKVKTGEPFGFTISNDTKKTDIRSGTDTRMEILSWANAGGAPYHSLKYYETGRTEPANAGWWLRGDYEWGMYVVIEYSTCHGPRIFVQSFPTTAINLLEKKICFFFDPGNCCKTWTEKYTMNVIYKIGSLSRPDTIKQLCLPIISTCVTIPPGKEGDTIWWSISMVDGCGNKVLTPTRAIRNFVKTNSRLLLYNNGMYSNGTATLIYAGKPALPSYDIWSVPNNGTNELSDLFSLYSEILIADGSFPARNIYTALKERLSTATPDNPVAVFLTSQDYGCFIQANCGDTTFASGMMEYDFFGIQSLGPQDLPPTNREFKIVPQPDSVTAYLLNYNAAKGTSLWYDPTFELGFAGYQDAVTPRPQAKVLFNDGGTNVMGVKYITPAVRTAFLGFDAGALQFRSDTSLAAGSDPKYQWIADVGSIANSFFAAHHVTSVSLRDAAIPDNFELKQNYPNPFNPSTTIEFTVPYRTNVSVTIYNTLGQKIATVAEGIYDPGSYTTEWNGATVSSGMYFYEMTSGSFKSVKKMLMMK